MRLPARVYDKVWLEAVREPGENSMCQNVVERNSFRFSRSCNPSRSSQRCDRRGANGNELGAIGLATGTISRHIICSGQLFAQFFRSHPEELPEAQRGQLQAQEAVRRLILSVPGPELV